MTATSHQPLDAVIRQIHSSVGNESQWGEVLGRVRELLRGHSATLAKHDFFTGRGEQLFESPANRSLWATYAKEHSVGNPWFMSSMDYQAGRVMTGEELLDPADLVRTDFYQRFLKQHGLLHCLCGVLARSNDVVHYVAVHRAKAQAKFGEGDKDLLAVILEHLTISLKNHWALLSESSANKVLREVLDRLAPAVFVVDSGGRVLFRNNECEEFFKRCQSLHMVDSRIAAISDGENRALTTAIAEVATAGTRKIEKVISVGGTTSPHPLIVSIRAAGTLFCKETRAYRNAVILFVKSPDSPRDAEVCSFSKIYHLTPAQARLTSLILSGDSRTEAARRLNVSQNTVRSHLKQIYFKTHTHGQMELVQLHTKICTDHH